MDRQFITAKEVLVLMDVSQGKAYQIIRQLNDELQKKGYLIVAGKVSRKYFSEKVYYESEVTA